MKMRQPYHLSWQLLTVAIIIAFIAFVEYWPHLSDDALNGQRAHQWWTLYRCITYGAPRHRHVQKSQEKVTPLARQNELRF